MKRARLTYAARLLACLLIVILRPPLVSAEEDKVLVSKVSFIGNDIVSDEDLLPNMIMRPTGFFGFFNDVEYDEDILEEDVQFIELYYQQLGWLDAVVTDYVAEIDSSKKQAKITVTVEEGPRTYVVDVLPLGNTAFDNEQVLEAFNVAPGDPLDRLKNRAGAEKIIRMYAEEGYIEASVNPAVMIDKESLEAYVDISITEGTQFKVGQVIMSGLRHSQSFLVRRELEFATGEILSYSKLAMSQRYMYETGLFSSVFIRQEPSLSGDSTSKDILVEVVDKPPILFTTSVGFATLEKLRGRIGIRNENMFGTGRAAGLETWISYIDRGVQFSYLEPRTFYFRWNTDVTITGEFRDEPSFDYVSYGGTVTESRRIFGRGFFSVSYRYENAEYTNIDVYEFDEETSPRIRSLNQGFSYDMRDDPFTPSAGWVANLSNEYALQYFGSTNEFFKTRLNFRFFHEWTKGTVLATNIEVGWVDAGSGLSDIPLGERLYAGGPNVLRGFPYRSVGPVDEDDGTPLGGRAKFAWNVLEVRQHIWRWVSMVGFYDVGNVFEQADDFGLMDLRSTPGLGVRVSSPVGLFRVDYGFNINPKAGEDPGAFHLSIGHAF